MIGAMAKDQRPVRLRPMTRCDTPHSLALLAQLGYRLTQVEAERRYAAVAASARHSLLVAEVDQRIVGLLHVYARPALEKPPEAVVQALVVDQAFRGAGIGRTLMAAAERWASEQGYRSVALSSNVVRTGAHAFYEAIGYQPIATSRLLRKELSG